VVVGCCLARLPQFFLLLTEKTVMSKSTMMLDPLGERFANNKMWKASCHFVDQLLHTAPLVLSRQIVWAAKENMKSHSIIFINFFYCIYLSERDIRDDDGLWKWNEGRHLSFSIESGTQHTTDNFSLTFSTSRRSSTWELTYVSLLAHAARPPVNIDNLWFSVISSIPTHSNFTSSRQIFLLFHFGRFGRRRWQVPMHIFFSCYFHYVSF
jgi:hypothetical protein